MASNHNAPVRLRRIHLQRYRKAKDVTLELGDLLVLIGPNGSGKSNILDSLRFLATAALSGDFAGPAADRGSFINLGWKGEEATSVVLNTTFHTLDHGTFFWNVSLDRRRPDFVVNESLEIRRDSAPPTTVLRNDPNGERWWWSTASSQQERLSIEPTACALGTASKNEAFPGRVIFDFVRSWVFSDPNPGVLKQPSLPERPSGLDFFGRNLAARLRVIRETDSHAFDRILRTVGDITGVGLTQFDVRDLDDGRLALSVQEPGLRFSVNQPALSNGILRILALAVALRGVEAPGLFAVEEPENYVHPGALEALMRLFIAASDTSQVVVTTHSPFLLNSLEDRPEAVCVVSGPAGQGTTIESGGNHDDVVRALDESGFSLGDFWLSRGFRGRG